MTALIYKSISSISITCVGKFGYIGSYFKFPPVRTDKIADIFVYRKVSMFLLIVSLQSLSKLRASVSNVYPYDIIFALIDAINCIALSCGNSSSLQHDVWRKYVFFLLNKISLILIKSTAPIVLVLSLTSTFMLLIKITSL